MSRQADGKTLTNLDPVNCPLGSLSALIMSMPPGAERQRLEDIRWLRLMAREQGCPEAEIKILIGPLREAEVPGQ